MSYSVLIQSLSYFVLIGPNSSYSVLIAPFLLLSYFRQHLFILFSKSSFNGHIEGWSDTKGVWIKTLKRLYLILNVRYFDRETWFD